MKLAQRIVLHYYRNRFKLLGKVSPRLAAQEAFKLFCTPYTRKRKYDIPPIFRKATRLTFILGKNQIHGFSWTPSKPNHYKILICHGFDSYSYKFSQYVEALVEKGFEVFAFDAPAHGLSSGKQILATDYRDTIIQAIKNYGPFHGIMSHSFGGLAVALALEMTDNPTKRLVFIAPATETSHSINTFFKFIPVSDAVKKEFENIIIELGDYPSSWYSVARVVQKLTTPTLWIHDEEDDVTPFADMQHLPGLNLTHLQFKITRGLGHSKIYHDPAIRQTIVDYFLEMTTVEGSTN